MMIRYKDRQELADMLDVKLHTHMFLDLDRKMGLNNDQVEPGFACPDCGEREIDALVWFDDEWVTCQSCGADYKPEEE